MQKTDQRQAVFTRIREALRRPAPHRHAATITAIKTAITGTPLSDAEDFRAWLPLVGPTLMSKSCLFAQNAAGLKADFRTVASPREASEPTRRACQSKIIGKRSRLIALPFPSGSPKRLACRAC